MNNLSIPSKTWFKKMVNNPSLSSNQNLPSFSKVVTSLKISVHTKTMQKYSVFSKREFLVYIIIKGFFSYVKVYQDILKICMI